MHPNGWDGIMCSIVRSIPFVNEYSNTISQMQQRTPTSQMSIFDIIEDTSTSSPVGFHVNHIHKLEGGEDQTILDTSFRKCYDASERFSQNGLWERMFTASLHGMMERYLRTYIHKWVLKATKCNRLYYQLHRLAHRINATEHSSSVEILPTPTCSDAKGLESAESLKKRNRGERNDLSSYMTLNTNGKNSQLNPLFVAEMMGFPKDWTISPYQNGGENP